MEHEITTQTVVINILVQLLNLILFFWLFKHFFGKKIVAGLEERKLLIDKLQNADEEYANMVIKANNAASEIIADANIRKKAMLEETVVIANQKADEIIWQASNKAEGIVSTAQVQAKALEVDLKNNYESMVKTTAGSYLKKIFDKEPDLQSAYMDKVIKGVAWN